MIINAWNWMREVIWEKWIWTKLKLNLSDKNQQSNEKKIRRWFVKKDNSQPAIIQRQTPARNEHLFRCAYKRHDWYCAPDQRILYFNKFNYISISFNTIWFKVISTFSSLIQILHIIAYPHPSLGVNNRL